MRAFLLALLLMGCQRSDAPEAPPANQAETDLPRPPASLVELTGLYEDGPAASRSRLCIIAGKRTGRFALVIRPSASESCSGSGSVARRGDTVRFTMQGDSPCRFRASIAGRTLIFPAAVPAGCAYYCGARTTLAGARLDQRGTGRAQAMKARDLVGDPLCTGE